MQYHEAANFLFDLRRFGVDPGIEDVGALLDEVGSPGDDVAFVQVAGSNGKGSTARMVESALREAGLSVGLYTSPHLETLTERIRVDGRQMPREAVAEFVGEVKPWLVDRAAAGDPLTFFEVVTAMGIWYFEEAGVDVAVLEVGLGGEFDATSAIDPVASALTTVSLEHTNVLGDTVEEIATTKAHVAPEGRPLVTGASGPALTAIRQFLAENRSGVATDVVTVGDDDWAGEGAVADDSDDDTAAPEPDVLVEYRGRVGHQEAAVGVAGDGWAVDAHIPLLGEHQAQNTGIACALAREVADELGVDLDRETLETGLRKAHWPGRFEVMGREPLTILDGAHNPDACATVAETLSTFDYDDLHVVFAAMHDKDVAEMIGALPTPDSVIACEPAISRAEDSEVLAEIWRDAGVDAEATGSVANALAKAQEGADEGDAIVVCGSLFAVAEARTTWTRLEVPKRIDSLTEAKAALEGAEVSAPGVWRMRGKAVHKALHTRVQERQSEYLKQEMLSLGGECATSGLRSGGELHDVVLLGTMAQFKRLCGKLEGQPWGLAGIGDEIRQQLGIQTAEAAAGFPWEEGPCVMGILNVTPDSFHDGGQFVDVADAVSQAKALVEAGADIIDVGGESTRPGADPVSVEEELDRVLPVVDELSALDCLVSIDTRRPEVARAAISAGADIVNDVTGLDDPEMRRVVAEAGVPVVVMHSIDAPVVPDREVHYDDVVADVIHELNEKLLLAEKAGIPRDHVVVDPGLGFGKDARENFALLGRLGEFDALGCPVLVGHSHKSMFRLTGEEPGDAPNSTVAATALAVQNGADIVRVHDVAENAAAVNVAAASRDPQGFDAEETDD